MRKLLAAAFAAVFMVVCLAGCTAAPPEKTDADYYKEYMELESTQAFLNDLVEYSDQLSDVLENGSDAEFKDLVDRMEAVMDSVINNENVPEVCGKMNKAAVAACENGKEWLGYIEAYRDAAKAGDGFAALNEANSAKSVRDIVDIDIAKFNEEHEHLKLEYE